MDRYTNREFLAAYDRRREEQARRMDGLQQSLAQPTHPAQAARAVDRAFVIAKRIALMDKKDRQTSSGRARLAQRNRQEYLRMMSVEQPSRREKTSRFRQQSPQDEQVPYDRKKPNLQEANLLQALSLMRIDPPVSRRQRESIAFTQMSQLALRDRQDYLRMKRSILADVRANRIEGVAPHGKSSRRRDAPDESPIKFKKL